MWCSTARALECRYDVACSPAHLMTLTCNNTDACGHLCSKSSEEEPCSMATAAGFNMSCGFIASRPGACGSYTASEHWQVVGCSDATIRPPAGSLPTDVLNDRHFPSNFSPVALMLPECAQTPLSKPNSAHRSKQASTVSYTSNATVECTAQNNG